MILQKTSSSPIAWLISIGKEYVASYTVACALYRNIIVIVYIAIYVCI